MTFPGWPTVLADLSERRDLDRATAASVLAEVLAGRATDAQIAAWIVALRLKGETVEELAGMVDAMLELAEPIEIEPGAIDLVGTGGTATRRAAALSVSTMASLVTAAAGARVCKHGNVKASATSGSFDTLAALGIHTDLGPEGVAASVAEAGVGFVFARRFHPAMRHVGPVRAQLGIPTSFNVLGPLANPARVRHHLIGVADPSLAHRMAEVLRLRGSERAWVVHGDDGLDEITLTSPTTVVELVEGELREFRIDPTELGLALVTPEDLTGGDPAANARIAEELVAGATGPRRDIVALNAAAALVVAGVADDLVDGLARADAALADGRAAQVLERVREVTAREAAASVPEG